MLNQETPRVVHAGNGTRGPFSLSVSGTAITYAATSEIVAKRYSSAGVETALVSGVDYTLSVASVDTGDSAATLTLASTQAVLASGEKLIVERVTTISSDFALASTGGIFEAALDKATRLIQELDARLDRAVVLSSFLAAASFDPTLPSSATAGYLLAANSTASGFEWVSTISSGTTVSAPWASVLGTSGMNFSGLSGAMRIGDDPDKTAIEADAVGGLLLNVTKTSTVTTVGSNSGNNVLIQGYLDVNPASAQVGDIDHRAARFEVGSRGSNAINETVGLSGYNFHHGTGALTIAYGVTGQFFNQSTATVATAIGTLAAVWQNGEGVLTDAHGLYGICASYRASGVGVTAGTGVYGEASVRSTGTATTMHGGEFLLWISAGGTITNGHAGRFTVDVDHASATLTNGYGVRIDSENAGTLANLYKLYIAAHAGTAPSTSHYAVYCADTARSYFAGNVGIGDATAVSASLYAVQGSNGAAARLIRTENGAAGPTLAFFQDSASPAANDEIAYISFRGRDSAANDQLYGSIVGTIRDATSGSEDSDIQFWNQIAGTNTQCVTVRAGLMVGASATDQGAGNINMESALYRSGTKVVGAQGAAVTDASGGATIDAEARTAINTLLARLRASTGHGLIA